MAVTQYNVIKRRTRSFGLVLRFVISAKAVLFSLQKPMCCWLLMQKPLNFMTVPPRVAPIKAEETRQDFRGRDQWKVTACKKPSPLPCFCCNHHGVSKRCHPYTWLLCRGNTKRNLGKEIERARRLQVRYHKLPIKGRGSAHHRSGCLWHTAISENTAI